MKSKKIGTLLIGIGVVIMLIAALNGFIHFSDKLDITYLTGVGVVFLCSGTIIKNKKPL